MDVETGEIEGFLNDLGKCNFGGGGSLSRLAKDCPYQRNENFLFKLISTCWLTMIMSCH